MKKDIQHYYTATPNTPYEEYTFDYKLDDTTFKFTSASGVFSKHQVDYGSQVLIKAILDNEDNPSNILDIGCGYGVIGVVLSTIFNCDVLMCDINTRAIELANKNAKSPKAKAIQSNGFENIKGFFDIIATNPPIRAGKEIYYNWFKQALEHLHDQGNFYCVIRKKQGAPSAKKLLIEIFGNCNVVKRDNGYYILKSTYYK